MARNAENTIPCRLKTLIIKDFYRSDGLPHLLKVFQHPLHIAAHAFVHIEESAVVAHFTQA